MSSSDPGPRPRQVTVGGWLIAVASLMLVASVFDTMANLRSVDTRDALAKALSTGWAEGLGMNLDDALTVVRAGLFVAGVAAAVTGILGIYVLQRHATARIVLTLAAVPVVLTAGFTGGFLAVVIGAATALLWSRPARDWFAGRPPARPETRPAVATRSQVDRPGGDTPAGAWPAPVGPPAPQAPAAPPESLPPPTAGWGQPAGWSAAPPAGWDRRTAAYSVPSVPSTRPLVPTHVRVACALTWVFTGLTAAIYLVLLVLIAVDRPRVLDLLRDNPGVRDTSFSDDQLVAAVVAASAVVVAWCVIAGVLAFLAWRRQSWAWITLVVSVGMSALVEVLALPFTVVHLAAAAIALRLLLIRPTREWFRREGGPPLPPPPPPPPSSASRDWPPPSIPAPPPPPSSPPSPPQQPPGKPPVW